MSHKLDDYDKKEIKDNMDNHEDLIFVVDCLVRMAYDSGYEEGYNNGYEESYQDCKKHE